MSLPRAAILRLPLCLLLLSMGPLAMAQTARVASPGPGNEAPERSSTEADDEARDEAGNPARRGRSNRSPQEEANAPRVPRWHSYLPGMFR